MKRTLLAAALTLSATTALAQQAEPQPSIPSAQQGAPAQATPPPAESGQTTRTTEPSQPKASATAGSSWIDKVKLSGKSYLRYSYETTGPKENQNAFAIDRLYLQGEFQLLKNLRFQATLEAGDLREGGTDYFDVATKYGFLELKDLLGAGTYVRGGLLPLAWNSYEEDLWGYRVASPVAMDRWGYVTSSDLGLSVGGALPSKSGSWQVNVNNGEGWKKVELGKRKELQARLTLNPLASLGAVPAGFFLTGYASYGNYDDAKGPSSIKQRLIGQVGYASKPLTAAVEYVATRDPSTKTSSRFAVDAARTESRGRGVSAFAVLGVDALAGGSAPPLDLIARYDWIDPDTGFAANEERLFIGGLGYRVLPGLKSAVTYERASYGTAANKPSDSRVKLLAEVKF